MREQIAPSYPGLPDVQGSRAVIVGISEYVRLEKLPSVANNVDALEQLFTDQLLWGLPPAHCVVLRNPATVDEVLDAVHVAADEATEAFVVYFAGHGLVDGRGDLYLALPDSDDGRLHRAVRYDDLRREVVSTALRCPSKVVILDCCYSGRAMLGGMSSAIKVVDQARIDGTYLMTASAETKLALAPIDQQFTAFTGSFIQALANGIPEGPELLGLETIFWHIRAEMQAKNYPVPQQRTRNDGKDIAIARNRWCLVAPTATSPRAERRPSAPSGFERLLSMPPVELLRLVEDLRNDRDYETADQVLAAAAARRPDQEVAAIIGLLRRLHRSHEAQVALAAIALRPPLEVISLITALRETEQENEIGGILAAASKGPTEDVASLAAKLHTSGHAEEAARLLDATVDSAATADIVALIEALSVTGAPDQVDDMFGRVVATLPSPEAVLLADGLCRAGKHGLAFPLYLKAVDETVRRPTSAIAELTAAMILSGSPSHVLVETAAAQRSTVAEFLDLAQAFFATGQHESGALVLAAAALRLDSQEVLALADELRAGEQHAQALAFCLSAAAQKPIEETPVLVRALRNAGRPIDANKVLDATATNRDARDVGALATLLISTGASADAERILEAAAIRPSPDVAHLLDQLTGTLQKHLLSLIGSQSVEQLAELIYVLASRGRQGSGDGLIVSVLTARNSDDLIALHRTLNRSTGPGGLFRLIDNPSALVALLQALQAKAGDNNELVRELLQTCSAHDLPAMLNAMREAELDDVDRTLTLYFRLVDADEIAMAIGAFSAAGQEDDVQSLLTIACRQGEVPILWALAAALAEANWGKEIRQLFAGVVHHRSEAAVRALVQMLHGSDMSQQANELIKMARTKPRDTP